MSEDPEWEAAKDIELYLKELRLAGYRIDYDDRYFLTRPDWSEGWLARISGKELGVKWLRIYLLDKGKILVRQGDTYTWTAGWRFDTSQEAMDHISKWLGEKRDG